MILIIENWGKDMKGNSRKKIGNGHQTQKFKQLSVS